jgi:hypothetical protein
MRTSAPEFSLRIYRGRESGLMIIGSAEALTKLGTQLQAASSIQADERLPDWPPQVAAPKVSGPYQNDPAFQLSFHVLRAAQLPSSLRLARRRPPLMFSLTVAVLALIGATTIITWIVVL